MKIKFTKKLQLSCCVLQRNSFLWCFALVTLTCNPGHAFQGTSTQKDVDTSLLYLAELLNYKTDYNILFNERQLRNIALNDTIAIDGRPIKTILNSINEQVPISYSIDGRNVSIRLSGSKDEIKQQSGRLSGHVFDEQHVPLPGATITIEGANRATATGFDGDYNLALPAGEYTVVISYISFETQRIANVVVTQGETQNLDVTLQSANEKLGEVVINTSYNERVNNVSALNTLRKNEVTALDGITAAQISATPDNNASQVLRRIAGLHVQDDKYVVVRGVSERYNNVSMNGALMPSTEANRRNYAFDIVPSSLIGNVIVHKSGSPDLPGEFTGGYVNVNTIEVPREDFLTIKVGTGGNENTFEDTYAFPRYDGDYLAGWGKSSVNIPNYFREAIGNVDQSDPENFTEASKNMPGNDRFRLTRYKQQPTQDHALSFGKIIDIKDNTLGITGAATYRNEQTKRDFYNMQPVFELNRGYRYNFLTRLGAVLNASYSFGLNKINLKNTFYKKLETETTDINGADLYNGFYNRSITENRIQNNFWQSVLEGEHALSRKANPIKIKWNAGWADYSRDQPNNIEIRGRNTDYFYTDDYPNASVEEGIRNPVYDASYEDLKKPPYNYIVNQTSRGPSQDYYSYYDEKRYNWGGNGEIPFLSEQFRAKAKIGYSGTRREASNEQFRFALMPTDAETQSIFKGLPYYEVYNQKSFNEELLFYRPLFSGRGVSNLGNGFDATQDLHAGFAMLDFYPAPWLHVSGGIRVEDNTMETITTYKDEGSGGEVTITESVNTLDKTDYLLSVNLIAELTPQMNLRGSFYKSLARPEFTELGDFSYYDLGLRTVIISGYQQDDEGNDVFLEQTKVDNAELRWEFYPSPKESFSLAGFYKQFENPIELTVEQSVNQTSALRARYRNLKEAQNYGLEVDFRKDFSFIPGSFFKDLYLFGNASVIWSTIYYDTEEGVIPTGDEDEEGNPIYRMGVSEIDRPLYGQAPYIINAGLQYDGHSFGLSANYNRVGPRVILPAEVDAYSIYEKPRNVVDLQLRYNFLKNNRAQIKLNLRDIFNDPVIQYNNNIDPNTLRPRTEIVSGVAEGGGSLQLPLDDPSGSDYDEQYDTVRRRFDLQRSFTLSFLYTF